MDKKSAAKLLASNLTAIYGYAYSKLFDKNKVDELASDIVYEVIMSADNLQNEEAFWGFVWRTAENTFKRFVKRSELAKKYVEYTDEYVGIYEQSPEQEYIQKETENEEIFLLRRELSLLKRTHREVCVAYYVENKSCSQISKEINISVEMVKYYLFKTRKILKEGIGMTRTLGEKSYNPGVFRLDFWGDWNKYGDLFKRKLPGSIVLAAYGKPMTAEEISMELGVSMPYLEDELETLEAAGAIKKIGEKYQTNIVIITDSYEKEFIKATSSIYASIAESVFDKVSRLLPEIRTLGFHGNDYDDNRLLFGILNISFVFAYISTKKRSPLGQPNKLPLGSNGWIFGYDNDYVNHHYNGIITKMWNKSQTAWFSCENYKIIKEVQKYEHYDLSNKTEAICGSILEKDAEKSNPSLPWLIENAYVICKDKKLSSNFPVFKEDVFDKLLSMLSKIIEEVADCMIDISKKAEAALIRTVPASLKDQCSDIAKIHHRMDVSAFLMEYLINEGKLTLPNEKTPLCMWGVKA